MAEQRNVVVIDDSDDERAEEKQAQNNGVNNNDNNNNDDEDKANNNTDSNNNEPPVPPPRHAQMRNRGAPPDYCTCGQCVQAKRPTNNRCCHEYDDKGRVCGIVLDYTVHEAFFNKVHLTLFTDPSRTPDSFADCNDQQYRMLQYSLVSETKYKSELRKNLFCDTYACFCVCCLGCLSHQAAPSHA